MEPSPGYGGISPRVVSQDQAEHMNGDGRHLQNVHEDHEGEPHIVNASPAPEIGSDSAHESDQEGPIRTRPEGAGDDEFESFHRSFTVGTNALDSMAPRATPGPFPDPGNGQDPTTTTVATTPASPEPVNPAGLGPQEQHQPPQPSSSPPPSQLKEDPTVVQARKSMLARTGDRHARGKLPEPKEGRFLPPDCLPTEPQLPAPRSSKRYMKHKSRSPDVFEGCQYSEDSKALEDDEHVIACRSCNLDVVVKKAAVVVLCESCGKINPASSMDRLHESPG